MQTPVPLVRSPKFSVSSVTMGDNEHPQEFVLRSLPKMDWVTPVKNVVHFQFSHVGYEMLADFNFSDIEDEEKKNKSVKTSLVLAAQKGDFQ
mmetsp:Transcript_989/g.2133  ORF Transcript_989/g.2133 Transcript_989/m.2133 type:complete len:92 (-) Transcript_989:977-1252(-)